MEFKPGSLLAQINEPKDLRNLEIHQLPQVAEELRTFIIDIVANHGGHFGASLGVVELTTALHYVYNTPYDQLVWDVGHQAYGHKILTGRRDRFHTNRVYKGLSGFPKRSESPYDTFGVGHSSTSVSAALGMAVASKYKSELDRKHIAVIGDGAMTGGIAFEGLNHGGVSNSDLLVVLNDNCMSIDPNVGALKEYLTDITTSPTYNKVRDEVWNLLGKFSKYGSSAREVAAKVQNSMKTFLSKQSNLFESLNFRYFGPVDGHDVVRLASILEDMKNIPGPKILHTVTVKGKGFLPAEKDQLKWHAASSPFDKVTGEFHKVSKSKITKEPPKFQKVFGKTILELAKANDKIMGVTPAMPSGSSLNIMMEAMPDRAFDVGIAEQHAVTFSAGLATQGLVPYCNVYSTFMQRGYDQMVHDVCIQNLPVVFCLDRAGLVGADGPTHHGVFDLAYMNCLPNIVIASPMNEAELRHLMYTAQFTQQPFAIRYPRGKGVMPDWEVPFEEVKIGTGRVISEGERTAVLSLGPLGNGAADARKTLKEEHQITIGHFDMRFMKPLDEKLLHHVFSNYDEVITIEDGCIKGGFGSEVVNFMVENGYNAKIKKLGIPDRFIEHGTQPELYRECNMDAQAIVKQVLEWHGKSVSKKEKSSPSLTELFSKKN